MSSPRNCGGPASTSRCGAPRRREPGTDAAIAAAECAVPPRPLAEFAPAKGWLVVDALFGAGLARPLDGVYAEAIARLDAAGARVVAVDLPSGVSGLSGAVLGSAPRAETTVTFFRKKPGHLLYPGRRYCGEIVVADIGIRDDVLASIGSTCARERSGELECTCSRRRPPTPTNMRAAMSASFPAGSAATGAARLAAMAAARAGAGAVTLLSPANALAVNAAHLTSIILKKAESMDDVVEFMAARKPGALVFGPGLGTHAKVGALRARPHRRGRRIGWGDRVRRRRVDRACRRTATISSQRRGRPARRRWC